MSGTTVGHGVLAFAADRSLVWTAMTDLQLSSEAGKTYLPGIQKLFEDRVNIDPPRAPLLIADIATGRFDILAGGLLGGFDNCDALAADRTT